MKRIVAIAALLMMALSAYAQSGKEIYNRYSGKKGVSSVYISPTMFGLMKELPDIHIESGDVNFGPIIKTFDGMYILSVEDSAIAADLEKEIGDMVSQGRFELLMEEDEQIFAYTRTSSEGEMLVCANFSGEPAKCPLISGWKDARELIHNYHGDVTEELRPYEAVMLWKAGEN